MTNLQGLLHNSVLIAALTAWALAQIVKLPIEYVRTRRWNWALLLRAGGMPSSHSALVAGAAPGHGAGGGGPGPFVGPGDGCLKPRPSRPQAAGAGRACACVR